MRTVILPLVIIGSVTISGCVGQTRWKSYDHNSTAQFERDKATCEIEAKHAYHESEGNPYNYRSKGTVVTEHEGTYDEDSGEYEGTSRTHYEKDPMSDLSDHVAKKIDQKNAFKLCMKSRGYYEADTSPTPPAENQNSQPSHDSPTITKSKSKSAGGDTCSSHSDCEFGLACNDEGRCEDVDHYLSYLSKVKLEGDSCDTHSACDAGLACNEKKICENIDVFLKRNSINNKKCATHGECPDGTLCDSTTNKCIDTILWNRKYQKKDNEIKSIVWSGQSYNNEKKKTTNLKTCSKALRCFEWVIV